MNEKGRRVNVGARLPPELWERLQAYARRRGQPTAEALERAVTEFLEDNESIQLPPELMEVIEKWYKDKAASGSR